MDEEEIYTPYLSDDIELKKLTPVHVLIAQLKINAWQWFAHHPVCSRYKNHYFTIGNIHLCVGCTSVYTTFVISLILFLKYQFFFIEHFIILPLLFLYAVIISMLHVVFKPEKKVIKAFSRASLGLGGAAYITMIIFVNKWYIALILGLMAFIMVLLYGELRKGANLALCQTCPMKYHDPPCDPILNTERKMAKLNRLIDEQIEMLSQRRANRQKTVQQVTNEQVTETAKEDI